MMIKWRHICTSVRWFVLLFSKYLWWASYAPGAVLRTWRDEVKHHKCQVFQATHKQSSFSLPLSLVAAAEISQGEVNRTRSWIQTLLSDINLTKCPKTLQMGKQSVELANEGFGWEKPFGKSSFVFTLLCFFYFNSMLLRFHLRTIKCTHLKDTVRFISARVYRMFFLPQKVPSCFSVKSPTPVSRQPSNYFHFKLALPTQ